MTELILHHYPASPVSEKVRLAFGLKGLAWRSVVIPNTMPRPDLMPLTGGYRRTPVLQIGADVYCDSQCILRELERRFPEPTLFPEGHEGVVWGFSMFTDRLFFQASVGSIFGSLPEGALPRAFLEDRERFSGRPLDLERMRAAAPDATEQWLACARLLELQLSGRAERGQEWLLGDRPGLADLLAFMNVWFVGNAHPRSRELLSGLPAVRAWGERVGGLGHGEPTGMTSAEALRIGAESDPDPGALVAPLPPQEVRPVTVTPDDVGRIPVAGNLVASDDQTVTLARTDEHAGAVHVHFPRLGFHVTPGAPAPED